MAKALHEMSNDELLEAIRAMTPGEKATVTIMLEDKIAAAGAIGTFTLGNKIAREGCDRCFCGCKYWEFDRCIDCGTMVIEVLTYNRELNGEN